MASWISNYPSALGLGRALRLAVNEVDAAEPRDAREVEDVIVAVAAAVAAHLGEYAYDEFVEALADGYHGRDVA